MNDFLELDRRYVWHPFTQAATAPRPLGIVRGRGAHLYDADGRSYLDLIASWWTNVHGHAHPAIARAIAGQAETLEHVIFAGVTHPPAAQLAHALVQRLGAPFARVFFTDNGSTAIEVALKIAFQSWSNRGDFRWRVLAFEGGYHGDTFGAMSVGQSSGLFSPFSPWLFEVETIPYPATWIDDDPSAREDAALAALDAYLARHGDECAALLIEPLLQGAVGMRVARPSFIRAVVERVRAHGIIVIFDEILTGFGRTGTFFAFEQTGVVPDLIALSKGLTGGALPMGATVATEALYERFLERNHRSRAAARAFVYGEPALLRGGARFATALR